MAGGGGGGGERGWKWANDNIDKFSVRLVYQKERKGKKKTGKRSSVLDNINDNLDYSSRTFQ